MGAHQKAFELKKAPALVFPTDAAGLILAIFLFSVALFKWNQAFLFDPDVYWHLAIGRWMLAEHAFPAYDVFSHTAAGRPWVNVEWLSQVLLFWIYDWFGWRGL